MTEQSLPFQPRSETSLAAAERKRPTASAARLQVLAEFQRRGSWGGTDEEVQVSLGMDGSTERPRRVELVGKLLVVDSGHRRKTMAGRDAVVWKIA